jgi:uncharacterized membrane protein YgcG
MNADADPCINLDRLLEEQLRRRFGNLKGPSPSVAQSAYQATFLAGRRSSSRLSAIRRLFSRTLVLGVAFVALLVAGTTVATVASAGPRPEVWGRVITTAIEQCRDELADADHDIGECVRAVPNERGKSHPISDQDAPSGIHVSGAPAHGSPVAPANPPSISEPSLANPATPGAGAPHSHAAGQGAIPSKGQSKNQGTAAQADNHSGESKSGGSGKSGNGGGGSSNGQRSGSSASPSPQSATPSSGPSGGPPRRVPKPGGSIVRWVTG